ncbi:hypothetical protein B0H17DRAFT_943550 [Mycena rosella]|uniref:DUF6593 domain-containing protein n=1 Tax=Mycena rosella TaxID=1033263 RepID=A0AAD7D746_MYCRO|nr:hypothetical protein B0H17DRAFT_943550 [Mycena rosella]
MHLYLTTSTPTNSIYTDESGALRYKVHTPMKPTDRTTAISRVVEGIPHRSDSADGQDEIDGERFANLAHIDWHPVKSSVIRFRGRELATQDSFAKKAWGGSARGHRVFTAQDGKEYKWVLGAETTHASGRPFDGEMPVARYHPKKLGLFSKSQKASLEVFSPFEEMADEIVASPEN